MIEICETSARKKKDKHVTYLAISFSAYEGALIFRPVHVGNNTEAMFFAFPPIPCDEKKQIRRNKKKDKREKKKKKKRIGK